MSRKTSKCLSSTFFSISQYSFARTQSRFSCGSFLPLVSLCPSTFPPIPNQDSPAAVFCLQFLYILYSTSQYPTIKDFPSLFKDFFFSIPNHDSSPAVFAPSFSIPQHFFLHTQSGFSCNSFPPKNTSSGFSPPPVPITFSLFLLKQLFHASIHSCIIS